MINKSYYLSIYSTELHHSTSAREMRQVVAPTWLQLYTNTGSWLRDAAGCLGLPRLLLQVAAGVKCASILGDCHHFKVYILLHWLIEIQHVGDCTNISVTRISPPELAYIDSANHILCRCINTYIHQLSSVPLRPFPGWHRRHGVFSGVHTFSQHYWYYYANVNQTLLKWKLLLKNFLRHLLHDSSSLYFSVQTTQVLKR